MEHKQQLELAQVLKLSPTLLQSMGILQMTTLELADYLQDLALENPVMEETPGARETAWDAFASRVPWLPGRGLPPAGRRWGNPAGGTGNRSPWRFSWRSSWTGRGWTSLCWRCAGTWWTCWTTTAAWDPEDLADLTQAGVPEALLEEGVAALQSLDPAGVGARSAGESLALQLKRQPGDHRVALAICEKGLDLLAREQYGPWPGGWGCPESRWKRLPKPSGRWTPTLWGRGQSKGRPSTSAPMPGWRRSTGPCRSL